MPNDWTIGDGYIKTPMPAEGAIGPQKEWTGLGYNEYNKGDAYTKNAIGSSGFTLEMDVEFDSRFVQPDVRNGDENITDADDRKLSFVANSGIKFGGVHQENKYEIALLDVVKWVELAGGIDKFNDQAVWIGGNQDTINIDVVGEGGLSYKEEPLSKLMNGVSYGGVYANMEDDQTVDDNGVVLNGWEKSYAILKHHYDRMKKLSTSFTVKLEFVPAAGGAPNRIVVSARGGEYDDYIQLYEEENPPITVGVDHLSLQSHWGSGVKFSNISLT